MININKNESFELTATNSSGIEETKVISRTPPSDNYNCNFEEDLGKNISSKIGYVGNYTDLSIKINGEKRDNNSYYLIDHLCAYGDIQSHTLFTSTGNWNNKSNWSHLPALRNRNALIQGKAIVDESIKCNEIHLYGEIEIINGGELAANKMTIHKEFPEKGNGILFLSLLMFTVIVSVQIFSKGMKLHRVTEIISMSADITVKVELKMEFPQVIGKL